MSGTHSWMATFTPQNKAFAIEETAGVNHADDTAENQYNNRQYKVDYLTAL